LHFRVHAFDVVDADVGVPDLLHDPPVGNNPRRFVAEREQDRRLVAFRGRKVGRMAEHIAVEAEPLTVVGGRSLEVGDEQHGRDSGQRRHARMLGPGSFSRPRAGLDTLAAAAYPFLAGAWLTVESRSSIEARRLEGLLLRVRVVVVAAPERGAARWWCARTAPPR
jgi:hypothetical protein